VPDCFFVPRDGGFQATELTRGPWSAEHQHAGPATGLVGREIEAVAGPGWQLGRLTLEILRALPITTVGVAAEIVRPGRSVQLAEATLSDDDGPLLLARSWLVREGAVDLNGGPPGQVDITPPGPAEAHESVFFPTGQEAGWHTAMDIRFLEGEFTEPGPAKAWMRMKAELVEGEEPTQLSRVLVAADGGNGVSSPLDYSRYLFINADLSVALMRLPVGEWVLLDAVTYPQESGIGLTDTVLADERGRIGRATQTLLVSER